MSIFQPIQSFSDFLTYNIFHLSSSSHIWQALNFFVYDSIKIFLLLILVTQIMSFVNVIFPIEKIRDFLKRKKLYWLEYLLASIFGAITPFCSCSSIPLFVGFLKWWIPLWVTLSFLITSPLVNEVAIALFIGIFGIKITLIYMISGILLWVVGWILLSKLNLERYVADFILKMRQEASSETIHKKSWQETFKESSKEWWNITKKVLPYVLVWVGIGGLIHGFVPVGFFENYITKDNPFAVPLAVIIGIPMYANAVSIIPIIQALIVKGVPLWTGLAFMMAVVGLSLPEFLILKKVMKIQLLLIYFGTIWFFIILLGYFYNIIL